MFTVVLLFVLMTEPQSSMSTSFTIENIFYYLRPLATKWRKVGNALSIPENLLCSISSTSDSDEECLRCLIKTYMEDNSFTHSWKEIVNRLSSIQEHHIAKRIDHNVLGVRFYSLVCDKTISVVLITCRQQTNRSI